MLERFRQDVRYAWRSILHSGSFAVLATLALALGIGINTAIFSVVSGILLRPLPYPASEHLVSVTAINKQGQHGGVSYPDFLDLNRYLSGIADCAVYRFQFYDLTGTQGPEEVLGVNVSPNLFSILGVKPVRGRIVTTNQEAVGPEVTISHELWERRFSSSSAAIGSSVNLNGVAYRIAAVMPPGFRFPPDQPVFKENIWVPLGRADTPLKRTARPLTMIARLRGQGQYEQAQAVLNAASAGLAHYYPNSDAGQHFVATPLSDSPMVQRVRPALFLLLGAVTLVLLVACANVANLQLARATIRYREMSIRAAVGATPGRIVRLLLAENLLLALISGALGLGLAVLGLRALVHFAPSNLPRLEEVRLDGPLVVFTLGLSVITGLISGLLPAIRSSRADIQNGLRDGGRSASGSVKQERVRAVLLTSEVALSVVLLIGAGLLVRSFAKLFGAVPGLEPARLLTVRLQLSAARYSDSTREDAFRQAILDRASAIPGVMSAAATSSLPLQLRAVQQLVPVSLKGVEDPPERIRLRYLTVTPKYFHVIGIPILRGSGFTQEDREDAPPVALLSNGAATLLFGAANPVGRVLRWGPPTNPWLTVAGVVGDVRLTRLEASPEPVLYVPYSQIPDMFRTEQARYVTVVLRAAPSIDTTTLLSAARQSVWSVDRNQPIAEIKTMPQIINEVVAPQRFYLTLLSLFAVIAVCLGMAGIYAVVSYFVNRRTQEIGVRVALGADPSQVVRLVVWQGLLPTLSGAAIGIFAALALNWLIVGLLYDVSPRDLPTYTAVCAFVIAAAVLASYLPARRATRIDPLMAMRHE